MPQIGAAGLVGSAATRVQAWRRPPRPNRRIVSALVVHGTPKASGFASGGQRALRGPDGIEWLAGERSTGTLREPGLLRWREADTAAPLTLQGLRARLARPDVNR